MQNNGAWPRFQNRRCAHAPEHHEFPNSGREGTLIASN